MTIISPETKLASNEGAPREPISHAEAVKIMLSGVMENFAKCHIGERSEASAIFLVGGQSDFHLVHQDAYAQFCNLTGIPQEIPEPGVTDMVIACSIDSEYLFDGVLSREYTPHDEISGHVTVTDANWSNRGTTLAAQA